MGNRSSLTAAVWAALFFVTMPVYADGQESKTAADIVAKFQSQLNLTQDEIAAVTPIVEKYMAKRKELWQSMGDAAANRGALRAQLEQLREDENQELSQILTQDQMSQLSNVQNHARHIVGASNGL